MEGGEREVLPCCSSIPPLSPQWSERETFRETGKYSQLLCCSRSHHIVEKLVTNPRVIWEIISGTYLAQLFLEQFEFSSVPLCYPWCSFHFQGAEVCRGLMIPADKRVTLSNRGEGCTREPTHSNKGTTPFHLWSVINKGGILLPSHNYLVYFWELFLLFPPVCINKRWEDFNTFQGRKRAKNEWILSSGMDVPYYRTMRRETRVGLGQDCVGCALSIWK